MPVLGDCKGSQHPGSMASSMGYDQRAPVRWGARGFSVSGAVPAGHERGKNEPRPSAFHHTHSPIPGGFKI